MTFRTPALAFLLCLGLAPAAAYAERPAQIDTTRNDSVQLAYRFSRGASQAWSLTLQQSVEGLQNTRQASAEVQLSGTIRYEVQSVDPAGVATITTTVANPQVVVRTNGSTTSAAPLASVVRAARVSQRIRPDGTSEERTQLPDNDPTGADTTATLTDLMSLLWVQFPAEQLRVGDSWVQTVPSYSHDPQNGINGTISIRYTFTGYALHRGSEHLVLDAIVESALDGTRQPSGANAQSARIVGRGHGTAYVLFHAGRGQVAEVGYDHGFVLTITEQNGRRAVQTIRSQATLATGGDVAAP